MNNPPATVQELVGEQAPDLEVRHALRDQPEGQDHLVGRQQDLGDVDRRVDGDETLDGRRHRARGTDADAAGRAEAGLPPETLHLSRRRAAPSSNESEPVVELREPASNRVEVARLQR